MSTPVVRVKKEAIYAAAALLFREKGYAATSMRELAATVGLEASSLYSHIQSKADLLDHICFTTANAFTEGMAEVLSSCENPIEQIRQLIALHVRIALQEPISQTVFNDEWRHLPQKRLEAFVGLRKKYEQDFKAIIERGQVQGLIPELPSETILRTLLSGLRWVHAGKHHTERSAADQLANDLTRIFIGGLKK